MPDGRRGQLLAVVLAILVLAPIWIGIGEPLMDWYADRAASLSQQRTLARHMEALATTLPLLQEQATHADAGPAADALIEGSSDAVAGAALQQLVQDMARGYGILLDSFETLPPQEEGRYRRIRLQVVFSAQWPVLVDLLRSIERARPRMLVDNLDLEATTFRDKAGDMPIKASFTILGFREQAASPGAQ